MSELEKLLARSKKVKIGEIEVEVHSLSFDELVEVSKLSDKDPDIRSKATQDLIRKALKKSFPEATDDEIKRFDLRYLNDFLSAVFEVSNLQVDEKKLSEMTATYST
jgi:hypothetical protein